MLKPNSITLAGSKLARSWLEAGSKLVQSWFEAGSKLVALFADRFEGKFHYAIWFEAGSKLVADQLRTCLPNGIWLLVIVFFVIVGQDRLYLYVISRLPEQSVVKLLYDETATPNKLKYIDRIANEADFVR